MTDPNRHTGLPQLCGRPRRRYYTGRNLARALAVEDLRAMTHERMPDFVLEYLEAGSQDEATLARERQAFAEWRFMPRQLVDVSRRSLRCSILGKAAEMPLIVAPTGLNGLFRPHGDTELARGALRAGIPFVQSTMSNDTMEEVAKGAPGVRHWWQLYVFSGDEVWQELLKRADGAGCEALVLTTNTQIYGDREWDDRTRATKTRPSLSTVLDTAMHPGWLGGNLLSHGMPSFKNVIDFVPKDKRGFFESAFWIREHQPTSMSWDTVRKIRQRWTKPFILKGILNLEDVRRALDSGVDGIVLGSHGGRQLDWTVSALDLLPAAREIVGDRMALYMTGGVRRGTDLLKAIALGADAALAGRAPLYGLCAGGAEGVARALAILHKEACDSLGLLGANSPFELGASFLARFGSGPVIGQPEVRDPTAYRPRPDGQPHHEAMQ